MSFREVTKIYGDVRRDSYYYNLKSFIQPDEPVVKGVAKILSSSADPIATAQDFVYHRTKYRLQKGELWRLPTETLDAKVGDCISDDTPIWIRNGQQPRLVEARELLPSGNYAVFNGIDILTPTGFAPIISVRDKGVKNTVRIRTTSDIEATPEHKFLVNPNIHDVGRYCEAHKIGQEQLLRFYPEIGNQGGDYESGWALGLFFADGSCSFGKLFSPTWRLVNTNIEYLERASAIFSKMYPEFIFPIRLFPSYKAGVTVSSPSFDSIRTKDTYCMDLLLRKDSCKGYHKALVTAFRGMMYNSFKIKKVPDIVLNGNLEIAKGFLDGAHAGDGHGEYDSRITSKNKLATAGLGAIIHKLGNIPSVAPDNSASRIRPSKYLTVNKRNWRSNHNYKRVLDITTATGEFVAGDIAVKNCDCMAILLCSVLRNYLSPDEVFVAVGDMDGGHAWVMTKDRLIESTHSSGKKVNENRYSVEVLFNDVHAFVDTSLPDEFGFLFVSGRYNMRVV